MIQVIIQGANNVRTQVECISVKALMRDKKNVVWFKTQVELMFDNYIQDLLASFEGGKE